MRQDIKDILLGKDEIAEKVFELGQRISEDYTDKNPVLVCILKGSSIFMADLLREVRVPCEIDFMCVSSYGTNTNTSGTVKIIKDLDTNIRDRDVIIVEDILDSGVTLSRVLSVLHTRAPKSLKVCTLLNKPARRQAPIELAYCGFEILDEFVVGYGLDYKENYRNLPDICILNPEVYTK